MADEFEFSQHGGVEFWRFGGEFVEMVAGPGQAPEHVGVTSGSVRDSIHSAQRTSAGQRLTDLKQHVASVQTTKDHAQRGDRHEGPGCQHPTVDDVVARQQNQAL
jgi:hypothetical protein